MGLQLSRGQSVIIYIHHLVSNKMAPTDSTDTSGKLPLKKGPSEVTEHWRRYRSSKLWCSAGLWPWALVVISWIHLHCQKKTALWFPHCDVTLLWKWKESRQWEPERFPFSLESSSYGAIKILWGVLSSSRHIKWDYTHKKKFTSKCKVSSIGAS